ncbi:MAG TPA: histidine phosphatase family protein [Actinomycetota bacterium]|nr:histidine phosphatase family protein [Actinomycetota bacterium]
MKEPRNLFLIRHGRSDESSDDLLETPRGLQWNPPLHAVGREQAELLARRLALTHPAPAAVYCSPLRRARETIAPYVERTGVEVLIEDDLMEAHIGDWENKPFEEIVASDEEILHLVRTQRAIWHRAPGGETVAGFRSRVDAAIEGILRRHPDGEVLVVCHGGVINAYVGPLLGIQHEMFFLPENTSVNTVQVDGASRSVQFLNDVLHLTDPQFFLET